MRQILLSMVTLFIFGDAGAQGLYARLGVGYAIPVAGQTVVQDNNPLNGRITYTYSGTQIQNFDVQKASFSTGVQSQLGIGYMFNEHFGVELNAGFIASPTKYNAYRDSAQNTVGSDIYNEQITRKSASAVLLTPSLVYNTGGKHFRGYARGGMTFPLNTKITEEQNYVEGFPYSSPEYLRMETKTKFGVGFAGAMGLQYIIKPNVRVWAEASLLSLSLYTKESLITDHTLDGVVSTRFPIAGTVIKYAPNGTYSPTSQPAYSLPFSNAGFSVGIEFGLSKYKGKPTNTKQGKSGK